jgi:hypothetical protein
VPAYAKGKLAWGLCQRCGLRYYLRELVLDGYYPNIRVCTGCYDPPQPQERLAVVSDPVALWKPAPDAIGLNPIFLTAVVSGANVVLNWTSIGGRAIGQGRSAQGTANLSAAYEVWRSIDLGVTFTMLVSLPNTADEFGALAVETLTYTDVAPPVNVPQYYIRGYDVLENAEYG